MKILVIFVDMLRANRLSTFNSKVVADTELDVVLRSIGGIGYTNFHSNAPDTPRSMACFASSQLPMVNGCDTRLKWPRYFLKKQISTIYDDLVDENFSLSVFSNPNERATGLFSEEFSRLDVHNNDFNLRKFLANLELQENHFVFISLPDFHWALDDHGNSLHGENIAYGQVSNSLRLVTEKLDLDEFDHLFLFSDHGFKLKHELYRKPKYLLLNDDRTRSVLIHRKMGTAPELVTNDTLCDMVSFSRGLRKIIRNNSKEFFELPDIAKDYVIIEDHLDFKPAINQNLGIWRIIEKDKTYFRTLQSAYIFEDEKIECRVCDFYDEMLSQYTAFGRYKMEYDTNFRYVKLSKKQEKYMNGNQREASSKLKRYIEYAKDIIKG